jgi:hypothetical protein
LVISNNNLCVQYYVWHPGHRKTKISIFVCNPIFAAKVVVTLKGPMEHIFSEITIHFVTVKKQTERLQMHSVCGGMGQKSPEFSRPLSKNRQKAKSSGFIFIRSWNLATFCPELNTHSRAAYSTHSLPRSRMEVHCHAVGEEKLEGH